MDDFCPQMPIDFIVLADVKGNDVTIETSKGVKSAAFAIEDVTHLEGCTLADLPPNYIGNRSTELLPLVGYPRRGQWLKFRPKQPLPESLERRHEDGLPAAHKLADGRLVGKFLRVMSARSLPAAKISEQTQKELISGE